MSQRGNQPKSISHTYHCNDFIGDGVKYSEINLHFHAFSQPAKILRVGFLPGISLKFG